MRLTLLLPLVVLASACAGATGAHRATTAGGLRSLPRLTARVSPATERNAGAQACTKLPERLRTDLRKHRRDARSELRVFLGQALPTYDPATVLQGCLKELGR